MWPLLRTLRRTQHFWGGSCPQGLTSDYSRKDIRQCKLRHIVQWNRSVFLHIVKVTGGTKTKELSRGGAEATQRPEGTWTGSRWTWDRVCM